MEYNLISGSHFCIAKRIGVTSAHYPKSVVSSKRPPTMSTTFPRPSLVRYAWLSVITAVVTITMKLVAFWLTDSVGLLSDALEGGVNLVAAILALVALRIAERPPDDTHEYGHDKAEYFSSGTEGALIMVASFGIAATSVNRLLHPQPLERVDIGLAVALFAALLNLIVGQLLVRKGQQYESITLEADGRHLLSDVWTSVGVVIGVGLAVWTGRMWLDPAVALLVSVKIGWEGWRLIRRSARGLMDYSLPSAEREQVEAVLGHYETTSGVEWHALRTRQSGSRRFVSVHLLVPDQWSVQRAHDLSEAMEADLREIFPRMSIFTHIEPMGDPISHADVELERTNAPDSIV